MNACNIHIISLLALGENKAFSTAIMRLNACLCMREQFGYKSLCVRAHSFNNVDDILCVLYGCGDHGKMWKIIIVCFVMLQLLLHFNVKWSDDHKIQQKSNRNDKLGRESPATILAFALSQ